MAIIRKYLIFTLLLTIILTFICCAPQQSLEPVVNEKEDTPAPADNTVELVITRDFGKELIFGDSIKIDGDATAMTILQDGVEVETKYGGGFVNAINGISSGFEGNNGQKLDWFYYMNGMSCNMGATDYTVNPGDIEHWDFRDWSYYQMTPAIIGDFPQPFVNGFNGKVYPTTIIYQQLYLNEADSLMEYLQQAGVNNVSAIEISELTEPVKTGHNLILISGTDNTILEELGKAQKKLGLYVYVENGGLILTDASGNKQELSSDSAVIEATQNPWNPAGTAAGQNVLWIITGTNDVAVKNVVSVLTTGFDDIKYSFALAVTGTDIIKIP
jgi:hypothetical protein